MEGIYQNSLCSSNPSPYVLPPSNHSESAFQHSHYGSQYRSSAFSDARSYQSATNPYHSPLQHHSGGLNYGHSHGDINHHHDTPHSNHTSHSSYSSHYSSHSNTNHPAVSSSNGWPSPVIPWNSNPAPLPPPSRVAYAYGPNSSNSLPHMPTPMQRPKLTTTVWEDESTLCYQVDAKSVCVARRQDNDMINGTKLLNVVGMSRGKRDGILKNEKGRVVVKVGAMHLKGVWITFSRAKDLATKFKIADILYPLFVDDPSVLLCLPPTNANGVPIVLPTSSINSSRTGSGNLNLGHYGPYSKHETHNYLPFNLQSWEKQPCQSLPSITSQQQDQMAIRSQNNHLQSGSCSPVPGNIAPILPSEDNDLYLMNNPYEYRSPLNRNYGISSSSGNHSYNVYPTENASSPTHHHFSYESSSGTNASTSAFNLTSSTVNRKSHAVDSIKIEDDTDKSARIDYPHSPPPESDSSPSNKKPKYSSSSSAYHSNHATSPSTCSDTTLSQSLNDTDSSDKKNLLVSGSSFRTSSLLTPGRQSLSSDHSEDKTLTSGLQRGRKRGTDKVNTPRRRKVEADST